MTARLPAASARATPSISTQLQQHPSFQPWKDASQHGLQAIVAIPLVAGPDLICALAVYGGEHSFGPVKYRYSKN
jgi:small neutral amino acid transporter SnatA (MarC family)